MSDQTALQDRIAALFSEKLNLEPPSRDAELLETGLLDSLAFVDLLVGLEQEFETQISVDDLEIENFRSIERIAEFVSSLNGSKARA